MAPVPFLAYSGFIITLFLSLSIFNFLGLLPYVFTPTSNFILTFTLAFSIWLVNQLFWIINSLNYFIRHLVPRGTPLALIPLIVLIELIRNIIRPLTLAVRLAANIVAGHLLISLVNQRAFGNPLLAGILIAGISLIVLEISVALIQAYVFTTLRNLYLSEVNSTIVYENWRLSLNS